MKRHVCVCAICGDTLPSETHHLSRVENDPDFVREACPGDHRTSYPNLTNWHDSSGILPGIEPLAANLVGASNYLTMLLQRHGKLAEANLYRSFDHDVSHDLERYRWARPRGVGSVTQDDPDDLVILHHVAHLVSELLYRSLATMNVSASVSSAFMVGARFFEMMGEYPLAYLQFAESRDYSVIHEMPWLGSDKDYRRNHKSSTIFQTQIAADFEKHFIAEAVEFLRHMRTRERESVTV
jgi:hypothetical protein